MPDILIFKRRDKALVTYETDIGMKWIEQNMQLTTLSTINVITIDAEHIEDYIKLLEEAEVTVEVR